VPTYTFRCDACGDVQDTVMTIASYVQNPPTFFHCCKPMQRFFQVAPGMAVGHVFNDRHYQDMRATDGTDISSRAKHQAYMKAKGLTTADDFKDTWAKAAKERAQSLAGVDSSRAQDVADAIRKLGA
jgi:predicted nucleic acid-binding Zn ribbon protein